MSSPKRFCPVCGSQTPEAYCPADGIATFDLSRSDPESAKFAHGDLVAGRYRIGGLLGRGGFGAVYEAEHAGGLGRLALKTLTLAEQSIDDVRRFYREAQVTAQLRHNNTVRVFDVGQAESGALYIAMELLQGHTLEHLLKAVAESGGVMIQDEAIGIGIDVCKSLSEAHGRGLVHRDLKPANIMVTEVDGDRVVKVLDFGIAHVQGSSLTGTGRSLGTPAYMSPEQCLSASLDARSDLYALGAILYRCVVGRPPFTDPNPLSVMFAHANSAPPDLYAAARTPVSDAFVQLVQRALKKGPEERFASARDMRQALEAARLAPVVGMPSLRETMMAGVSPVSTQSAASTPSRTPVSGPWTPQGAALPAPETMAVDALRPASKPKWTLIVAGVAVLASVLVAVWSLTRARAPETSAPVVPTAPIAAASPAPLLGDTPSPPPPPVVAVVDPPDAEAQADAGVQEEDIGAPKPDVAPPAEDAVKSGDRGRRGTTQGGKTQAPAIREYERGSDLNFVPAASAKKDAQ